MIRIRPLIACGVLASLLACAEGSKVETVQPDRPANFKLDNAPAQGTRGDLVEATHVVSFSQAEVAGKLATLLSAFKLDAKNGVHIYKVKYQTQTPSTPAAPSKPVVASGLMIVPDSKLPAYPWISLQHGTITSKAEAPTVSPSEGIFEASQGFVTIVPDYIGYGSSSLEFHPYIIAQAYADSGVDFLTAAYKFSGLNSVGKGPLFLKGYSEGGYATLALQKELEINHPEFPLVASAPSAGPYDVEATAMELLAKDTVNPVNIPYLVLSYTRWLSNNDFNPNAIFNAPVADIQKLFVGALNYQAITGLLPNTTKVLLNGTTVDDFLSAEPKTNEGVKLHTYLKSQSLTAGWKPKKPTLLFHCVDDETVPVSTSKKAAADFAVPNVMLQLIPSPAGAPFTHGTCPAIFAPTVAFIDIVKKLSAK